MSTNFGVVTAVLKVSLLVYKLMMIRTRKKRGNMHCLKTHPLGDDVFRAGRGKLLLAILGDFDFCANH